MLLLLTIVSSALLAASLLGLAVSFALRRTLEQRDRARRDLQFIITLSNYERHDHRCNIREADAALKIIGRLHMDGCISTAGINSGFDDATVQIPRNEWARIIKHLRQISKTPSDV